jgi:hypothetical protein
MRASAGGGHTTARLYHMYCSSDCIVLYSQSVTEIIINNTYAYCNAHTVVVYIMH